MGVEDAIGSGGGTSGKATNVKKRIRNLKKPLRNHTQANKKP